MKIPRDVDGAELAKALRALGYSVARQNGSHMRVTTQRDGEHHEVIPKHSPLKIGTLQGILRGVASHHRMSVEQLLARLEI
jgi:predicted RNA binding protein YcfA (HicA-like mRNA interferase family)